MMRSDRTLRGLIASGQDEAIAIAAHGAPPLTYARLSALVDSAVASLNRLGVGRGDRVAIVLPNGPEMATAFLAVAAGATSAPLNPAYRQDEFEFYLSDLNAKALIVEAGSASPAIAAAEKLGVALITLTPEPQAGAGAFRLSGASYAGAASAASHPAPPSPTTSRSSCTLRAPPRGRRSCRWRTPISGPRPTISPPPSSLASATAPST